jgi:hypothetical protein
MIDSQEKAHASLLGFSHDPVCGGPFVTSRACPFYVLPSDLLLDPGEASLSHELPVATDCGPGIPPQVDVDPILR